jgi:transcriptional regulator with XRE-family HTH domain
MMTEKRDPSNIFKDVGGAIRDRRILLNLPMTSLAKKSKISRLTIDCIETARKKPTLDSLEKISSGLNIKVSTLIRLAGH